MKATLVLVAAKHRRDWVAALRAPSQHAKCVFVVPQQSLASVCGGVWVYQKVRKDDHALLAFCGIVKLRRRPIELCLAQCAVERDPSLVASLQPLDVWKVA